MSWILQSMLSFKLPILTLKLLAVQSLSCYPIEDLESKLMTTILGELEYLLAIYNWIVIVEDLKSLN